MPKAKGKLKEEEEISWLAGENKKVLTNEVRQYNAKV